MKPGSLALIFAALIITPCASSQVKPDSPRPITIDDYFRILGVHDPQLSPDGQWVAYAIDKAILKTDKNETRIWMAPISGGNAIPLTAEGVTSNHPRWSPDGKYLAFLSERKEGKTQVWLLNRLGGDAQQLTRTPQDVEDFFWSPDSRRLVLVLKDPTSEELQASKDKSAPASSSSASDGDASQGDDKEKDKKSKKPWVIDRLQFKLDEVGYLDRRRTHLYVFDLAAKTLTQVTSGDFDDSEPAWSPDGKFIVFSSNRSKPDADATYDINIWVVAADNTDKGAHLTQVTTNPGADTTPGWSPDGKWIVYVTQLEPRLFDYATRHIAVSPAAGGAAKVLTLTLDRMASVPRFSPDGKFIYFIADDDGTQNLCRVPAAGGEISRRIGGRLMVNDFALAKTGE